MTEMADALERYREATGIQRGTRDWCQLLAMYASRPQFFTVDQELARKAKATLENDKQQTEGSP